MIVGFIPPNSSDQTDVLLCCWNSGNDLYRFRGRLTLWFIGKRRTGKRHIVAINVAKCIRGDAPGLIFEWLRDICIFVLVKTIKWCRIFYPDKNGIALRGQSQLRLLSKLNKYSLPINSTVVGRLTPCPFVCKAKDVMPVLNRLYYTFNGKNRFNMRKSKIAFFIEHLVNFSNENIHSHVKQF